MKIHEKYLEALKTFTNFVTVSEWAEKFNGEWLENTLKAGVIKGNGSYKYESNFGTRVIPQGEVLLLR